MKKKSRFWCHDELALAGTYAREILLVSDLAARQKAKQEKERWLREKAPLAATAMRVST
jgi:hypothetical protein